MSTLAEDSAQLRMAVFDLDGTLVDSQGVIVTAMGEACIACGLDIPSARTIRRVVGLPLLEAMGRLFPALDARGHDRLTACYRDAVLAMRAAGTADEPLFPGVLAGLGALDAQGWLLGLATGKPYRGVVSTLTPHALLDRFMTIQTADRAAGKPSPDMLLQAMRETGTDAEATVMVGDTTYDMEMAANAGVAAIGVAWGYHEAEELRDAGARAVVQSFDELVQWLPRVMEEARRCA